MATEPDFERYKFDQLQNAERRRERYAFWQETTKTVLVGFVLAIVTIYLPHIIEKLKLAAQGIQNQREFASGLLPKALTEKIDERVRLAHFFSRVLDTSEQRQLWEAYYKEVKAEAESLKLQADQLNEQLRSARDKANTEEISRLAVKIAELERRAGPIAQPPRVVPPQPTIGEGGSAAARRLLDCARSELAKGVVENPPGSNDGFEVGQYIRVAGLTEKVPWATAFVSWCLVQIGEAKTLPPTPNPTTLEKNARDKSLIVSDTNSLAPGDIVIHRREVGGVRHSAIVASFNRTDGSYNTIEGNLNNAIGSATRDIDSIAAIIRLP